jgi:hypothetical protein
MSMLARALTYDDLERAREATNDRLEVIEGELFVIPSPSLMGRVIVHRLAVLIDRTVVAPGFGLALEFPLDVFLADTRVSNPKSDD